jgi:hypothetical protein
MHVSKEVLEVSALCPSPSLLMIVDQLDNSSVLTAGRARSRQVEERSWIGVGEPAGAPEGRSQVAAARRPLELARVRHLLPAAAMNIRDAEPERRRRGALETVLRGNRRRGLRRRRISVGVGRGNRRGGVRGRSDAAALGVRGPLVGVPGRGRRRGGLARAAADGDVAEGSALGPVAAAGPAEVARLRRVVVVVVAELGVPRLAPRARVAGARLPLLRRSRLRRRVSLRAAEVHASERRPGLLHARRRGGSER